MKNKVEIIGYYRRIRDKSEYILYKQNEVRYITNGIYIWKDQFRFVEKHLPELVKVEQIDIQRIKTMLRQTNPYSGITARLERCEKLEAGPGKE